MTETTVTDSSADGILAWKQAAQPVRVVAGALLMGARGPQYS